MINNTKNTYTISKQIEHILNIMINNTRQAMKMFTAIGHGHNIHVAVGLLNQLFYIIARSTVFQNSSLM